MTLEEARAHIGHGVVYDPPDLDPWSDTKATVRREDGVITAVGELYVFVRYSEGAVAKATHPDNLTLLGGES